MSAADVRYAVENAFRDYETDQLPASGKHEPIKAEIRYALGVLLQQTLEAVGAGFESYANLVDLNGAAGVDEGTVAYVYRNNGSATDAGNGFYQRVGSAWERAGWLDATIANAVAAALVGKGFSSGGLGDRGPTAFQTFQNGYHYYVTDVQPPRLFVWVTAGNRDPKNVLMSVNTWYGYYTPSEIKNLSIDSTGSILQSNVTGLADVFAGYDAATYAARISDFRARALTSGSRVAALLQWSARGGLTGFTLSWNRFKISLGPDARSFDTTATDWASQTRMIATGDSMLDNRWVEAAAAQLGYILVNVSKYSSGSKQVYRLGVRQLRFTSGTGQIAASGAGTPVSSINGVTPGPSVSYDAFAAEGFLNTKADDAIATHCSEAGTWGGRHGVVSVPNAGTPTYTFVADDGLGATPVDPQSVFVPDNLARLKTDEVLIRSTQNTFFAGPGNPVFPNDINPRVLEDIGLVVNATGGQRVTILSLTPAQSFDSVRMTALAYFNNQLATLWPSLRATLPGVGTNLDYIRANGSDGSANDQADIAAGKLPRSCMEDDIHLNAKGQALERAFFIAWRAVQVSPPVVTASTVFELTAAATNPRTATTSTATASSTVTVGAEAAANADLAAIKATYVAKGNPLVLLSETDASVHVSAAARAKLVSSEIVDPVTIGGRLVQPTLVYAKSPTALDVSPLGLFAAQGVYMDTGEPWNLLDPRITVQPVTYNGRQVQPTIVAVPSFAVIEGVYLDTGEHFPAAAVGYSAQEIVVVPTTPTNLSICYKGTKESSARYIRCNLYRFTSTDVLIDADVWRLGEQYECVRTGEFSFVDIRRLGNDAETDTAIWVSKGVTSDSGGLVGGQEHGGEKEDAAYTPFALMDDVPYDLSAPRRGQVFEFFHHSICYDWNGTINGSTFTRTSLSTTVVAKIGKRHRITRDGYQIDQRVTWGGGFTLRRAYFGMGVVYRTNNLSELVTTMAYFSPDWAPINVSAGGYSDTTSTAMQSKLSGPIGIGWNWRELLGEITRYSATGRTFFRDTSNRNKFYPDYSGGASPTAMAIWDVSSVQKFSTSN